ncbi:MAG: DUF177 domain-containing protein, partial [Bradyrhizobiaceae bacterium]
MSGHQPHRDNPWSHPVAVAKIPAAGS